MSVPEGSVVDGEYGISLDVVTYESVRAPFEQAVVAWMAKKNKKDFSYLLGNPGGCGLDGQVNFHRALLGDLLSDQFGDFWDSLSDEQVRLFGKGCRGWEHFFSEAAYTMFTASVMSAIEQGVLPHPNGEQPGTKRAGMPGSLENDTARALGSSSYDLQKTLQEHLKYFSSGDLKNDQALIQAMCEYLGLSEEQRASLEAMVLEHFGQPNIYHARRTFGALLQTALLQCYGIKKPYQRTTPEAIIQDQMDKWSWPAAYTKPPLLDEILAGSFYQYDPQRFVRFEEDLRERGHARFCDPDGASRIEEGQAIIDALTAFRAQLVGPAVEPAKRPGVIDV